MSAEVRHVPTAPRGAHVALIAIVALAPLGVGFARAQTAPSGARKDSTEIKIRRSSNVDHTRISAALDAILSAEPIKADPKMGSYGTWVSEDVAYLITPEERDRFLALKGDSERDEFIADFWKRRSPSPDAATNEFKREHYRRLALANKRFGSKKERGWLTSRGRATILLGPPDAIEDHADWQIWTYHNFDHSTDDLVLTFHFNQVH